MGEGLTGLPNLLKLCAVAEVLVIDEQTIYEPRDPDHKLLLNLKGTMSEVELHWLRLRLNGALRGKARRGELRFQAPTGYAWGEEGLIFEPDESARQAIQILFDRFEIEPSLHAVVRWAHRTGFLMPTAEHRKGGKYEIQWGPLRASRLCAILHNPTYAGVYAYGKRPSQEVIRDGKVRRIRGNPISPDAWLVRIMDAHPKYISWERYLENEEKLGENGRRRRPAARGAPREGRALLAGIVICGRCGKRMSPEYRASDRTGRYRYVCVGDRDRGGPGCWSTAGEEVDRAVEGEFLKSAVPDELELTLAVEREAHRQGEELARHWKLRIERAEYEARAAERRYKAVDPDNRVVARTLEHEWEMKLREVQNVQRQYEEARRERRVDLDDADRQRIRALARDLPAVWRSSTTAMEERKAMLRLAIEAVTLEPVESPRRETLVKVAWTSGTIWESRLPRSLRPAQHSEETVDRIRELASQALRDDQIAERLNAAGIRTGPGKSWNWNDVRMVRWSRGIPRTAPRAECLVPLPDRHPDGRYSIRAASKRFGVSLEVIRNRIRQGRLEADKEDYGQHHGVWWVRINDDSERRVRERREAKPRPKPGPLPERHPDGRYSIAGAARLFGVTVSTIHRLVAAGLLRGRQEPFGRYKARTVWWLEVDEDAKARVAARVDEARRQRTRRDAESDPDNP